MPCTTITGVVLTHAKGNELFRSLDFAIRVDKSLGPEVLRITPDLRILQDGIQVRQDHSVLGNDVTSESDVMGCGMIRGQRGDVGCAENLHCSGLQVGHVRLIAKAGKATSADDVTDFLVALVLHLGVVEEVEESPVNGCGRCLRPR